MDIAHKCEQQKPEPDHSLDVVRVREKSEREREEKWIKAIFIHLPFIENMVGDGGARLNGENEQRK